MKRSASGRKRRLTRLVIVDGYNVIARRAGTSLAQIEDLEDARREIEDLLSQYRAMYGEDVIVVYDAHRRPGPGREEEHAGIRIVFTESGETADARIERLVYDLRDEYREITVATSDAAEQQVALGGGALRISANELLIRLEKMREDIDRETHRHSTGERHTLRDALTGDLANQLERWRRR
ncbi:NYN domain-containing protein [Alicyclobacillus fructus]|uniref:YacP-like NYN domain-containing protein n=1 Tax=Alicyclobacillus fructus TaxID=2816082 RepID=UPI001A8F5B72|nr:NYN domain-containing protein [Alicyclobacillus fructus]